MQANPQALLPVIVEMQHPTAPFVSAPNVDRALAALDLLRQYGIPVAALSLIDGAAGFANAAGINAMSLVPTVARIHHDATVGPRRSADPPVVAPPDQVSEVYPFVVNANQVWQQGITGGGVTVAVLDSGVAADADLVQPANRILASVNFADQRLTSDPGGHGTHVAGIVAGNGGQSGGVYIGVAPEANIVDVRVLGSTGSGRISSVVSGIEWVLAHRTVYNIRVLNLSFGAPARTSYRTDPMSAAVEIAWRRGLVVVVAAGNGGAPRGAALLLQRRPSLSPDQVKAILVATTQPYGQDSGVALPDPTADGTGLLDALAAVQSDIGAPPPGPVPGVGGIGVPDGLPVANQVEARANRGLRPADSFARSLFTALRAVPLRWKNPTLGGIDWTALTWDSVAWDSIAWDNFEWDSVAWDSIAWDSVAWDSIAWDSVAWDSIAWDSIAWDSIAWD